MSKGLDRLRTRSIRFSLIAFLGRKMPKPIKKPVVVKVDATLKKLYAETLHRLNEATNEGAKSWDHRYEAIAEILEHEPPLYLAGGFATDADFLAKQVKENRQAVYRNIRVAKYANPEDIERFTAARLDLAISFVETKNGGPLKGRTPIDFERLHFPFKQDGKRISKNLADITVVELRAAIALLKGHQTNSKNASPIARALGAAIKKTGVKGVTASVSKKLVTLHIPLADLNKVAAALSKFKPPPA